MSSSALLSVRGLTVRYGGVTAVDGVDLDVEDGSFIGLIGPNGAGKTTLIDAIGGFCRSTGAIDFLGRRITRMSASGRARLGIGRTFQSGELFDDLTVLDNVTVGSYLGSLRAAAGEILRCRAAETAPAICASMEMFGLTDYAGCVITELPAGLRKLVAVARALAAGPRLLLLDEPAAGLDNIESAKLGEALRGIPASGTTVVLVDHDMDLVMGACTTVHVLDAGRIIASGTGADVHADPLVREAYLGLPALDGAP